MPNVVRVKATTIAKKGAYFWPVNPIKPIGAKCSKSSSSNSSKASKSKPVGDTRPA